MVFYTDESLLYMRIAGILIMINSRRLLSSSAWTVKHMQWHSIDYKEYSDLRLFRFFFPYFPLQIALDEHSRVEFYLVRKENLQL